MRQALEASSDGFSKKIKFHHCTYYNVAVRMPFHGPLHTYFFILSEFVPRQTFSGLTTTTIHLLRASITAVATAWSYYLTLRARGNSASRCLAKGQGQAGGKRISVNEPAMLELLPPLDQIQDQIRGMGAICTSRHRVSCSHSENNMPSYNVLSFCMRRSSSHLVYFSFSFLAATYVCVWSARADMPCPPYVAKACVVLHARRRTRTRRGKIRVNVVNTA
jgi:hypothetical protein